MPCESPLLQLPPEVLHCILLRCGSSELVNLSATCHLLYEAVQDEAIWRHLAKREYHVGELTGKVLNTYKKLYQKLLHPYGWMIGLYLSRIDYFGGLLEVKLSGDNLVAISLRVTQEGVLEENLWFEVCGATTPPTQLCSMIERPHATLISLCKDGESLRQKCQFHDTKFAQGHYNYNTLDGFRSMTTIDAHRLGILHVPLSVPSMQTIPRELWEDPSFASSPQKYSRGATGGRAARTPDAASSSQSPKRSEVLGECRPSPRFEDHRRDPTDSRSNDNYRMGSHSQDDNDAYASNSNALSSRRLCSPFRSSPSTASLGNRCRPAPETLHDEGLPSCSRTKDTRSHSRSYSNDSLLGDNFKETTDRLFEDIVPRRDQSGSSSRNSCPDGGSGTSTLVYNLLAELGRRTDNALNSRVSDATRDARENNNERGRSASLHSSQDDLMDDDLMNCSPSGSSNTFSKSSTNESISTASNSSTDSSTTVRENAAQANGACAMEPVPRPDSPEASSSNESHSRDSSPYYESGLSASPFYQNNSIRSSRRELALLYKETHCNPFPAPLSHSIHRMSTNDPWLDSLRHEDSMLWQKSQQRGHDVPSAPELPLQLPPHVLKPGLYYGHYGSHGYEIVMLEYRIKEIVLIKVLGDQYVPTREVTVRISLPFSFTMTAEEQRSKSCSDLLKVELESSKLPLSHYRKQPFLLPPFCFPGIETNIPSTCWARYHGLGQLANLFHSQPRFARVHVMVFNNEEFGVLFLSLKTFMMFRHIKRDFPRRPNIKRPEGCDGD